MKKKIFTLLAMVMVAMTASADVIKYNITKAHDGITIKVAGAEATSAKETDEVTVEVTPPEGKFPAAVVCKPYTTWSGAKTRGTSLQVGGNFVATKVKDADNTYSFKMPASNVEVSVTYVETIDVTTQEAGDDTKKVDNVTLDIKPSSDADPYIDPESGNAVIPVTVGGINVPVETETKEVTVTIQPQTLTADGNMIMIQKVEKNTFVTGQDSKIQIVGIFLQESKEAITFEEGALTPNGRLLNVATTLSMLDDYANMTSLADNVKGGKVSATTQPVNMFWTFSSGVDVLLPKGIKAFKVLWKNNAAEIVELTEDELTLEGGHRGIKANNGVLLSCDNGKGGDDYQVVASPGAKITGAKPATDDAKSYAGNCMVPTIEAKNYPSASSFMMMHANKFHTMSINGKVPACKAVLKVK